MIKRHSFNNKVYQDSPHLENEDTTWSDEVPRQDERFKEKPIKLDNNYLYTDENVDRFNAGKDFSQEHGQPKGVDVTSKKPVVNFQSATTTDEIRSRTDKLLDSFTDGEKIIAHVLKAYRR